MLKKFVAAAASIALVTTPVVATAASVASSEIAPASETISGDNQQIYGASLLLQAGILLALILGGYFIYEAIDSPSSP